MQRLCVALQFGALTFLPFPYFQLVGVTSMLSIFSKKTLLKTIILNVSVDVLNNRHTRAVIVWTVNT